MFAVKVIGMSKPKKRRVKTWLDETLAEASRILTDFCNENGIPQGRRLAARVVNFAKNPQRSLLECDDDPLSELELFVCVDALGDYQDDDELKMLFEFLRWTWWIVKIQELPSDEVPRRPHEIEEGAFNRPAPSIKDKAKPSEN